MKRLIIRITGAILILSFIIPSSIIAHQLQINFRHLKVQDGLSQSWVRSICQDKQGFLWFSTNDGLNKYDGYSFTVYKHNPKNKKSILSNSIGSLYVDKFGNLWINTSNGLNRYDPVNDQFIHRAQWPTGGIFVPAEFEDNAIYIADKFYLYHPQSDSFDTISYAGIENPGLSEDNTITSILKDKNGNIWIGTFNELILLDSINHATIHFRNDKNDKHSISDNFVRSLCMDSKGRIWVGTTKKGLDLLKYEKDHPEKSQFIHYEHDINNENSITNGAILALREDNRGHLWIGAENGGVDILDLAQFEEGNPVFYHYKHDSHKPLSISHNSIQSIYKDRDGSIWIGTYGDGVNIYNTLFDKFMHYKNEPNNINSINDNSVKAFFDEDDYLWIGTQGGLSRFDKKKKTFKHFVYDPLDNRSLGANAVLDIYKDSRGNLWIATWAGGLNLYDPKTGTFTRFQHDENDPNSLETNNIWDIAEDHEGNLWISVVGGGLHLLNRNSGNFKKFMNRSDDEYSISDNNSRVVFVTSHDEIWIGTDAALDLFDRKNGTFTHFTYDSSDNKSISHNRTRVLFEDSNNNLWAGTQRGLNVFNREDSSFSCYLEENGLPNDYIQGILEDNSGNLWISTDKGISKFIKGIERPENPIFKNYDVNDGLQGNEFKSRSCYKGKDGTMYFGGHNGFNVFHPDSIMDNPIIPSVVFTDFQLFNKSVTIGGENSPLLSHITKTDRITLSYKQSVFSFSFAALNYIRPEKNQYAFKMEGFDKEWNYVGNKRDVTYTNLDPGTYIFRVRGSNNDGVWNEEGASIEIIITPPFWATWWFRGLIIFVLIITIIAIIRFRTHKIQLTNKRLEQSVKERTHELEDKKNLLQTVIDLVPDSIYVKDLDNKFILNNHAHLSSLRLEKQEDILNKTDFDFFTDTYVQEHHKDDQTVINSGTSIINKEEKIQDPISNDDLWILTSKVPMRNTNGDIKGIVGISRDITGRKKFEEELKQAKLDAERASKSKSEFLANMSHEIRTPMNGVIGMTELAMGIAKDKKQKEYLMVSKQSAESLLDLLNDILDYSKIEAGKLELEDIDFNLRNVVEYACTAMVIHAHDKGLELICDIKPDIPVALYGDSGRLRQIIINLIGNAIKFTHQGEIVIRAELESISKEKDDDTIGVHFSIADTGIGISEEKYNKIFESFSQADNSTTRKYGGTGLGLSISQKLTSLMGGKIWVESEVNKGSTFHFTARFKPGKLIDDDIQDYKIDFKGSRVLIVDDNNTNCIIMENMMKAWGFETTVANNGEKALNELYKYTVEDNLFDLILLDYQMPEMDGFELAEKIRANKKWKGIQLVMMSSISENGIQERSKRIEINCYLNKPVRQLDLYSILVSTLGKPKAHKVKEMKEQTTIEAMPSLNILLAEDNIINQKVATNLLKRWGHEVTVANDGVEAIELSNKHDFDLIFMDIQMPNMDGIEATERIRNAGNSKSGIPIVAMTAHAMIGDRDRFLDAGMDDYISKPIEIKELLRVVKKYGAEKVN